MKRWMRLKNHVQVFKNPTLMRFSGHLNLQESRKKLNKLVVSFYKRGESSRFSGELRAFLDLKTVRRHCLPMAKKSRQTNQRRKEAKKGQRPGKISRKRYKGQRRRIFAKKIRPSFTAIYLEMSREQENSAENAESGKEINAENLPRFSRDY